MKRKRRNPFWIPFICCAVVSCIIISMAFFYVFNDKSYEMEKQYYQEKIENILDDFSFQLGVFEKIALRISINNKYQPFQLAKQKYSENELLIPLIWMYIQTVLQGMIRIYCSGEEFVPESAKGVYEAADPELEIKMYYKPDKRLFISLERFLIQIMLILADALLVITIAGLFAKNAYKPLLKISEKYRNENMLPDVLHEVEGLSSAEDAEYLYAVCNQEDGQFWVICSLSDSGKEKEITEYVKETVESFIDNIQMGVGRVYGSMDALSRGAKNEALQELGKYTVYLKENQLSLLMRQYIFTEFIGEISKLSKKYKVELSYPNLALIISSKSIDDFYEAAHTLISEFCSSYAVMMESKFKEGAEAVCRYITEHCAEYDLSVEKVAAQMGMTGAVVRDIVHETTGKNFRNYVVFLRVEYAKRLLIEEKLPVYEVGQKIGYSSVSHFIKIFKEETGQTPAKYVKENMAE